MRFSSADAAFEGFRVTRRHPVAVLAWAAIMFVANLLSGLAIGQLAGPAWGQFEALSASAAPDPALAAELLPKVAPAAFLSAVIQIVAAGVVNASVLRALLRPERHARLAFGRDELRVVGLMFMFLLTYIVVTAVVSIALALFGTVAGRAAAALQPVASAVVLTILGIRFSLAGPMTIAEHRVRFRASWAATRPWFWPLLGAEALAACLALVVAFLAHIVFLPLGLAVLKLQGADLTDIAGQLSPDFSTPAALLTPAPLVYLGFVSILYALVLVILVGPPVELYRLMTGTYTRDGR